MNETQDQNETKSFALVIVVLLFMLCLIGVALFLWPRLVRWYVIDESMKGWLARAGQYGDMYGAVNCLISGLGLSAVAATLVLQTLELKRQRRDRELDREERKQERVVFEQQTAAQKLTARISVVSCALVNLENDRRRVSARRREVIDRLKRVPDQDDGADWHIGNDSDAHLVQIQATENDFRAQLTALYEEAKRFC